MWDSSLFPALAVPLRLQPPFPPSPPAERRAGLSAALSITKSRWDICRICHPVSRIDLFRGERAATRGRDTD